MDLETKIEVLSERVSNLSDQLKRFISHLESEQRVTGEISKRVDQVSKETQFLQKELQDYKSEVQVKSQSRKWRAEILIAIAALLISSITSILTLFK